MSRISIDFISEELALNNWKIVSTDYTNLDSELEFICAEGHKVFSTWRKIRQKRYCPICNNNEFKQIKPITIIQKTKGKERILALDQATNVSGYSIFDGKKLVTYGTYTTQSNEEADRIHEVKEWAISMIQNTKPDLVGIEGIQYQDKMGITTFQTLARLQGVLIEMCLEFHIPFKVCPTNTWRKHCNVKGLHRADKKRSMQLIVKKIYDISVSDDAADAIGIGKYLSETHSKQVEIVNWE